MISQALTSLAAQAPTVLAADINTTGLVTWMVKTIVPLICLFIGIGIMASSKKGRVSEGLTTVGVLLLGLVVIAGGGLFFAFADTIAKTAIK